MESAWKTHIDKDTGRHFIGIYIAADTTAACLLSQDKFSEGSGQLEGNLINDTTHSFSLSLIISQTAEHKLTNAACGQICVTRPEGSA